jgi:energy-coupling factor transporter transmembrane protein EcfT
MLCLPTLSLGLLFAALITAQLINRDLRRLSITFLFALITLTITYVGCIAGGEVVGWTAFVGIIALIVLFILVQAGVFANRPSVLPNRCVPTCEQRTLCPGEEPCPTPDYLPE